MELLPFQTEDVEKLRTKRSRLIGNDPGTGKTFEGMALDLAARNGGGNPRVIVPDKPKTIVIAPKTVLGVWDDHLMENTKEDVYLYNYPNRFEFFRQAVDPRRGGYFIINWESLRIKDAAPLRKVEWFHVIGDEIQYAKNRKAQVTQALWKLHTTYRTAMSGTPADNSPVDLWAILHWLWPNYYTSYWNFVRAYTIDAPVLDKRGQDTGYSKIIAVNERNLPILKSEMEPWFVRRRKQDVLQDLPDKYYSRITVDLGPKQRRAYDEMKKLMVAWLKDHKDEIENENPIIANAVVTQLIRLQQFSSGYLEPILDEDGNQVVKYRKRKDGEQVEMPQWRMTKPSAKLDAVMELIEQRPNEPLVFWSWSRMFINLLAEELDAKGYKYGKLTGEVSAEDRRYYVDEFQAGRLPIFIGTIKAGGIGITLHRASTAVFVDRAWNPSHNVQAEDREHRIGQKEAVQIIDIMARNTVDLGKHQKLSLKWQWLQKLFGDVVDLDDVVHELELSRITEVDVDED